MEHLNAWEISLAAFFVGLGLILIAGQIIKRMRCRHNYDFTQHQGHYIYHQCSKCGKGIRIKKGS